MSNQFGEFRYEDRKSELILKKDGRTGTRQNTFNLQNAEEYTGEWYGKMRHGKGKNVLRDGSTYEGYWLENKKNGFGRYIYHNADVYLGYWKNDLMDGQGTYIH